MKLVEQGLAGPEAIERIAELREHIARSGALGIRARALLRRRRAARVLKRAVAPKGQTPHLLDRPVGSNTISQCCNTSRHASSPRLARVKNPEKSPLCDEAAADSIWARRLPLS